MTDTLLRAVLDHPLDNAHRLAYADALGDDPRAEFIRIQLKKVPGEMSPRERELIIAHRKDWLAPIAAFVEVTDFRRGFVEYASTDAKRFLAHADALFAAAPIVHLRLTDVAGRAAEVFANPALSRVRALDLSGAGLDDSHASLLAGSPHLRELLWLNLSRNKIGRPGLDAIAASPHLANLRWLGFDRNLAPDPVPRPMLDGNAVTAIDSPAITQALIAAFGKKKWLEPLDTEQAPSAEDMYRP